MSRNIFLIAGFALSAAVLVTAGMIASHRLSLSGKAADSKAMINSGISAENSYLFASPLKQTADGKSLIRITAFILDNRGKGVTGMEIKLNVSNKIQLFKVQDVTDRYGKVIYDAVSTTPGNYTIEAFAANKPLAMPVGISFE